MSFKILFFLFLISFLYSQSDNDIKNKEKIYILKDIVIVGTTEYSKLEILQLSGLKINESINIFIPEKKINFAIKKLWETNFFSDIDFFIHSFKDNFIILKIHLVPLTTLGKVNITGAPKRKIKKLKKKLKIKEGIKVNMNLKNEFINHIIYLYKDKGFCNIRINFIEKLNIKNFSQIDWNILIHKNNRIKIQNIKFKGNYYISSRKLLSTLKNTKKNNFFKFWKHFGFNPEQYQNDLVSIINKYRSYGFRNAKILHDSVSWINQNKCKINIIIDEGKQFFLGNIRFLGNINYSNELLFKILNYKKGEIYNQIGFLKKIYDSKKNDDISTFYINNGYLFSNINFFERSVRKDTIDVDILINEGLKATWNKVTFSGNYTIYDHVIQRFINTLSGELFSKEDIKRTYFDLSSISYIESQKIKQQIFPNPINNTVDIHWHLIEKGSSQVQLQGGYGAGKIVGTFGFSFSNFSLHNSFKINKWKPIPSGEGQTLSLQAQAGGNFQNYSITFTEPWIASSTPLSLSLSTYCTISSNSIENELKNNDSHFNVFGTSFGLNKLLSWPDNWFRIANVIAFQIYTFNNYNFTFKKTPLDNSSSQNFNYTISFLRNSQGNDPFFPTFGSEFDLSLKFTPPYSLINTKYYNSLILNYNQRSKWIEYYKVKIKGYWYHDILKKSILKIGGEFGVLRAYQRYLGISFVERFFVGGGIGFFGNRFDSREIISLRGYQDVTTNGGVLEQDITPLGGGTIYNKFMIELRYPIRMRSSAKIYALTFLEAANTWENQKKYQPFDLRRSVGFGLRVLMPTFGIFGFDLGYGFDNPIGSQNCSGWQTHFIVGQQF